MRIFVWIFSCLCLTSMTTYAADIMPIGGSRDAHGCLTAAGYSWNTSKQQCTRPWEDVQTPRQLLQSGSWSLVSVNGVAVSGTLSFPTRDTFTAKVCNTMNGTYRANQKQIIFSRQMSTMMYCAEDGIMTAENAMHFNRAKYSVTADTLTLVTTQKNTLIFKR